MSSWWKSPAPRCDRDEPPPAAPLVLAISDENLLFLASWGVRSPSGTPTIGYGVSCSEYSLVDVSRMYVCTHAAPKITGYCCNNRRVTTPTDWERSPCAKLVLMSPFVGILSKSSVLPVLGPNIYRVRLSVGPNIRGATVALTSFPILLHNQGCHQIQRFGTAIQGLQRARAGGS